MHQIVIFFFLLPKFRYKHSLVVSYFSHVANKKRKMHQIVISFFSFPKVSFATAAQNSVVSSENEERQLARVKSDFCPITFACRPAFFLLWVFVGVGRARRSINSLKLGSSNERKSSSIWGWWWLAGLEIGRKMKREKGGGSCVGVHRGDGASPSGMDGG